MKACVALPIPNSVGNVLGRAASIVNERLGGGCIIPTAKGMPLHVTLRSPVKSTTSAVHCTRDLLQDLPSSEMRITGFSSFPVQGVVFAKVALCPFWSTMLDTRLEESPLGLGQHDLGRTAHVTIIKGLQTTHEVDEAISTIDYWAGRAVIGKVLPVDRLVIYIKKEGARLWEAKQRIDLGDVRTVVSPA